MPVRMKPAPRKSLKNIFSLSQRTARTQPQKICMPAKGVTMVAGAKRSETKVLRGSRRAVKIIPVSHMGFLTNSRNVVYLPSFRKDFFTKISPAAPTKLPTRITQRPTGQSEEESREEEEEEEEDTCTEEGEEDGEGEREKATGDRGGGGGEGGGGEGEGGGGEGSGGKEEAGEEDDDEASAEGEDLKG